jgi:hypothetical protein
MNIPFESAPVWSLLLGIMRKKCVIQKLKPRYVN